MDKSQFSMAAAESAGCVAREANDSFPFGEDAPWTDGSRRKISNASQNCSAGKRPEGARDIVSPSFREKATLKTMLEAVAHVPHYSGLALMTWPPVKRKFYQSAISEDATMTHKRYEQSVVERSGMTSTAFLVALTTPHAGMPMFTLTGEQRDDIIAYILSLH